MGRQDGDPSVALMQLIGRLQHLEPNERSLVRVGPQLYGEAITMILKHGTGIRSSSFWANQGFAATLFCGHWISPLENVPEAAQMHCELIEWRIAKMRRGKALAYHCEGAQSLFGLSRARKIVKSLKAGWEIRHASTLEPPKKD